MYVIYPQVILEDFTDNPLQLIARAGRTCYQSQKLSGEEEFFKMLLERGHFSVLEHVKFTFRIICNRGCSHELVRHRLASFSQESTRYVSYKKGFTVCLEPQIEIPTGEYELMQLGNAEAPLYKTPDKKFRMLPHHSDMLVAWLQAERAYKRLREMGVDTDTARYVLPLALKTELVMTANLREWLHFVNLRYSDKAHPMIRGVASHVLTNIYATLGITFSIPETI